MPKLNKFTYNICSIFHLTNPTYLPSSEYIKSTLKNLGGNKIISSVDYFPNSKFGQCHIYSYPYTMRCYNTITNNFPGGLFEYVQKISLFDEHPFEHEFFMRISQAFPFLKKLVLANKTQQKRCHHEESNNENENLPIIQFLHLNKLDLTKVHNDYVVQFLMDTKTCLPTDLHLNIDVDIIKRMMKNEFKRDAIQVNCAKVKYLHIYYAGNVFDDLYVYFPNAIRV